MTILLQNGATNCVLKLDTISIFPPAGFSTWYVSTNCQVGDGASFTTVGFDDGAFLEVRTGHDLSGLVVGSTESPSYQVMFAAGLSAALIPFLFAWMMRSAERVAGGGNVAPLE
jgi:hypothetical protein